MVRYKVWNCDQLGDRHTSGDLHDSSYGNFRGTIALGHRHAYRCVIIVSVIFLGPEDSQLDARGVRQSRWIPNASTHCACLILCGAVLATILAGKAAVRAQD